MARVWTDGAEFGDSLFFNNFGGAVPATPRSGSYSYYVGYSGQSAFKILSPALDEFYYRGVHNHNLLADKFLRFRNDINEVIYFELSGIGIISAYFGGGAGIALGSIGVAPGFWNLYEIYLKIADAPNGRLITYINGIKDIDFTGDTLLGSYTTIDNIYWYGSQNSSGGQYFDDLALNDTSGVSDNSWCGDGHIEVLMPDDNGDLNQWMGSDADKVDNYLLVDERPPDTDDYVYSSDASMEQDMYDVADFSGTGKIIQRVWAECRAADVQAGSGGIKLGFKTGGTVYLSSAERTLPSNYSRIVGDDAVENPADTDPWEDADLDAIQFVVECE